MNNKEIITGEQVLGMVDGSPEFVFISENGNFVSTAEDFDCNLILQEQDGDEYNVIADHDFLERATCFLENTTYGPYIDIVVHDENNIPSDSVRLTIYQRASFNALLQEAKLYE